MADSCAVTDAVSYRTKSSIIGYVSEIHPGLFFLSFCIIQPMPGWLVGG